MLKAVMSTSGAQSLGESSPTFKKTRWTFQMTPLSTSPLIVRISQSLGTLGHDQSFIIPETLMAPFGKFQYVFDFASSATSKAARDLPPINGLLVMILLTYEDGSKELIETTLRMDRHKDMAKAQVCSSEKRKRSLKYD